jgi:hypothetical protein
MYLKESHSRTEEGHILLSPATLKVKTQTYGPGLADGYCLFIIYWETTQGKPINIQVPMCFFVALIPFP